MEKAKFCLIDQGETVKADIQGTGSQLAGLLTTVMIDHPSLKLVVKEALRLAEMEEKVSELSDLAAMMEKLMAKA
jgi:hypothetical protein